MHMRRKNSWLAVILAMAMALSLSACGSKDGASLTGSVFPPESGEDAPPQEEDAPEAFVLSMSEVTLPLGSSTYIDAYNASGEITWSCSNTDAVEMQPDGDYVMVKGIGVCDGVTITARVEGQGEANCVVKVISTGMSLCDDRGNSGAYSSGTYAKGTTHTYEAFLDNEKLSGLTWGSLDESVAKVSDGTVSMVDEGMTYIYAKDGNGNAAYASVWVSDTGDDWETKIPDRGLFFEMMFTAYEEKILDNFIPGEGTSFSVYDVYDDGQKIDNSKISWSYEDSNGHVFDINTDETNAENVSITYTGAAGQTFLVATNTETGHTFKYLVQTIK